jgi:hypothetical protein
MPRFDGKVLSIDAGLPRVYDYTGMVACLAVEDEQTLRAASRSQARVRHPPGQLRMGRTTWPCTSVSRKCRP